MGVLPRSVRVLLRHAHHEGPSHDGPQPNCGRPALPRPAMRPAYGRGGDRALRGGPDVYVGAALGNRSRAAQAPHVSL